MEISELSQEFLQRIYGNAKKLFILEYGITANLSHIVIEEDCGKLMLTLKDDTGDCEVYITELNDLLKDEEINKKFENFNLELSKRQKIVDDFIKNSRRNLYEQLKKEFENESK